MNDKKAKKLRGVATAVGKMQGLPERLLIRHNVTGLIINHPKSVRGLYRHLKKLARQHNGINSTRTPRPPSS